MGDNRLLSNYDTVDPQIVLAEDAYKYIVQIDEVSDSVAYYGWAVPGTPTSDSKWRIMKKSVSGNVTSYLFADGNSKFDNIWDNRASLTYS
jgi:hypothetical protein